MPVIGKSVRGVPIKRWVFFSPSSHTYILFLAGVHGDEVEGVELLRRFQEALTYQKTVACHVHMVPCLNPDGYRAKTRVNANGVDLNRNLPTQDWSPTPVDPSESVQIDPNRSDILRYNPGTKPGSEPENQALISLIQERPWKGVISLHSYEIPMVNYNGTCSEALAKLIAQYVNLPTQADIGYPTPGSLGTWVGHEMHIPCVTLEVPKGKSSGWECFVEALCQVVQAHNSW